MHKFLANVQCKVRYIRNQKAGQKKKDDTKDGRINSKRNHRHQDMLIRPNHYDTGQWYLQQK